MMAAADPLFVVCCRDVDTRPPRLTCRNFANVHDCHTCHHCQCLLMLPLPLDGMDMPLINVLIGHCLSLITHLTIDSSFFSFHHHANILTHSPPLLPLSPFHITGLSSSTPPRIDIDPKTAAVAALPTAYPRASKQNV